MAATTTKLHANALHAGTSPRHAKPLRCADLSRPKVSLGRNACGVLLEVEERQSTGARIVVVTAFTRSAAFDAWCADDPLRFDAPIAHQQIRRDGDALWRGDR
jgi:hypothetical protein